jgi:anti-anti-sigma factor
MAAMPGEQAYSDRAFWCRLTTHGDWQVVELGGDLDWTSGAEIRRLLCGLRLPRHGRLAMDMRALTFMDSTGIRVLLHGLGVAEERGARYAVIRGIPLVHSVLELVGLDEQLDIVEDPEDLA